MCRKGGIVLINVLDKWMSNNINNFNTFVAIITIVAIVSLIAIVYFSMKIGKLDERTSLVYLKILRAMFITLLISLSTYISLVDSSIIYNRQYLICTIVLALFVGAIMSAIQFKKEFNNL